MILRVEGVSVNLSSREVLKDVTFAVERGELVSLLGPNGSGKSTLLRTIFGILKPVKGAVLLDGKALKTVEEAAKSMGYLPQESAETNLRVLDVVLLGRMPHLSGIRKVSEEDLMIAMNSLREVGIEDLADRKYSELSGGEKQKVMLARVFAQQPEIMLLDEPTAHLDISAQIEIMETVRRKVDEGCAALVAMHDINLASMFSDKILMVKDGKIAYAGSPEEAITKESIRDVFNADVIVKKHGRSVYTIPRRKVRKNGVKVHVICGGGCGREILHTLAENGYEVSAGVVNVLDSDWEAIVELEGEFVEEAPFSPISEKAHERNLEAIISADVVVLANIFVGPGNLKNLEAAEFSAKLGKLIVVEKTPFDERNFAGSEAKKRYESIVKYAIVVKSEGEVVDAIRKILGGK